MKKNIFTLFALAVAMTASASGNDNVGKSADVTGDQITDISVEQFVDILQHLDGHVFLTPGESRDLSSLFKNSSQLPNEDVERWSSVNPGIASVSADGEVVGHAFGETILTAIVNNETHHVAVFVCPTITVKSPEGAIYVHQKMYKSAVKLQLTQSPDWVVNCVMMAKQDAAGEWQYEDVTGQVDEKTGIYTSTDPITENLILTVSMALRERFGDGENVIGTSDIDFQVRSQAKTITVVEGENSYLREGDTFVITDMNGKEVDYTITLDDDGYRVLNMGDVQGIFTIKVKAADGSMRTGQFKVIIQREYEINQFS